MARISNNLAGIAVAGLLLFPATVTYAQYAQHPSIRMPGIRPAPGRSTPAGPMRPHTPHTAIPNHHASSGKHLGPQLGRGHQLPPRQFGGRIYYGTHAWRHGVWRHQARNGLYGWWWDLGSWGYYYTEPTEGPPDYVSEIAEPFEEAVAAEPPRPPSQAFYYRPGDLKGVPYDTLKECDKARAEAGNIGMCVWK
jgi:hypothetical protein